MILVPVVDLTVICCGLDQATDPAARDMVRDWVSAIDVELWLSNLQERAGTHCFCGLSYCVIMVPAARTNRMHRIPVVHLVSCEPHQLAIVT